MERSGNFYKAIRLGYILISILIGCMAYNSLYEWQEIEALELGNKKIDELRKEINNINIQMIKFSLLGETILEWNDKDIEHYHARRMAMDSMLCRFKATYPAERIDSVRSLLEDKERQMFQIVRLMDEQQSINKKIANQIPVIVQKSVQEQSKKPKRKGFLGIFGKKKEVTPAVSTTILHSVNRNVISEQKVQDRQLSEQADSLAARNAELNRQLQELICQIEEKVQTELQSRENEIVAMREKSFMQVGGLMGFVLLLLLISYIIIHRDAKSIKQYKHKTTDLIRQLEQSVQRNEALITSRKKAVHTITHELRTPLTAIGGNAELLLNDTEADNRIRHAQAINDAAGRMAGMINNLLVYFRLDSGKETPVIKPFKLRSIAEILETEFAPLAKNKGLGFNIDGETDDIVSGDRNRILSIGSNLLSNAIKFTKSGTVTLSTSYKNNVFTLAVEDTGTGMTEEQQSRVFAPFERLGNAVTEDGFGLGLAIVSDTVKLLNGSVKVESEPGIGSRFTVSLPLPKAEETMAAEKTTVKHSTLSGCSVLAIDNNGMLLDMMKEMYRQSGVKCDTCQSVDELTDRMRTKDYDLLVTDLKMPEVNGYGVLELLRTSEIGNSQTIPVVAATAAGYVEEKELTEKGFAAVLYKPYSIDELLAVTERCIKPKGTSNIDLSPLLAFGDKRRTLEKLAATTQSDMDEVRKAAEAGDMEALDSWIHHLRSSWMLIKAEQPLAVLYDTIHKGKISDNEVKAAVDAVLAQGKLIVDLARKEAERWAE
ncbi:hybrid sensor histidine kinase/response regulator [Bacteroides thetaiotaomicron]|uniref:hybrid sensor histidine kinase/response regulator n=1 Tax=Bacteroides thetaiotaomicron TaxID=818 RepID=UPI0039B4E78A